MENSQTIEALYDIVDKSCLIMYENIKYDYLTALVETCNNISYNKVSQDLNDDVTQELLDLYKSFDFDITSEEIRKVLQLCILKGIKHSNISKNIITPDTIAYLFAYLINKFYPNKEELTILDPSCGTSNLLTCIANNIESDCKLIGIDNDNLAVNLSKIMSDMQDYVIEILYQDAKEISLNNVDLVVSDLDYDNAHEIILKHIDSLKEGGYLIALIYNDFFSKEEYREKIMNNAYLQGIIQLPDTIFQENMSKSIVIIQRKGNCDQKEFLLTKMDSLTDQDIVNNTINKIEQWHRRK